LNLNFKPTKFVFLHNSANTRSGLCRGTVAATMTLEVSQFMDVMTTYLYGSLDSDIYMNVPNGISVSNMNTNHNMYCVKLVKSVFDLKQSERMWDNGLKEFLLNKGYSNSNVGHVYSLENPMLVFA
jgi:hypothetical protein